jgi:fibronectin-binding autotransporter adhesin
VDDGVFVINRTNAAVQGTDFSGSAITGTGSFVQAGTGSVQLTAANSYNGTTTVSAGTLIVGDGAVAGTIGTGAVTLTAGALAFNRTDTHTLLATNLVTGAGGVTLNSGTVAAAVDGQFNTTGALILGSPNGSAVAAALDLTNGSSSVGSLTVQTNSASINTITIGAGKTLTINGSVSVGNTVSTGQLGQTFLDFLGTGALVVNAPAGTFKVGNNIGSTNNSADGTVVLSTLSNVTINLGSGALSVQPNGDNGGGNALSTLTLSDTANTITAAAINVGPTATGAAHVLNLGDGTNVLNTDALNLGTGAQIPVHRRQCHAAKLGGHGPGECDHGDDGGPGHRLRDGVCFRHDRKLRRPRHRHAGHGSRREDGQ